MVDDITCMEISPGSIRVFDCGTCGNEAFTFDAVALGTRDGEPEIRYVGTIRRCYGCEDSNG